MSTSSLNGSISTEPEIKKEVRTWRYWFPRIVLAVLIPILLLGILEFALRLCGVGTPTSVLLRCTDRGRPGFCDNQFFTSTFFPPGMARTPRPYFIPAEKRPGTYRIFVLGESAAWGDPDPTYGFSRYMEVMLRQTFPSTNFEVINTGTTAINSHVMVPIAKELASQQPDLYVIYAGNNEVVGPFGPGTMLTGSSSSRAIIRSTIFLRSTRIDQLLSRATTRSGQSPQSRSQWRGMEMFLGRQLRFSSPALGPVYDIFASNLREMIQTARSAGARVIVSTIATNLADSAPFASLHREGLAPDALKNWSSLFEQGIVSENAGAYEKALTLYRQAEAIDQEYAELQFRIARCFLRLGDFDSAKARFARAQDLDTLRFRADSKTNASIRSVAAMGGLGAELVDAAETFSKESPHGIAGSELFYEHVHMNPEGNYLLARAIVQQIASKLPSDIGRASNRAEIPSQAECDRLLALTPYDRARLADLVLRKMERAPFSNQANIEEERAKLKAQTELTADSYDETLEDYRWAISRNPSDRMLHLNYAFLVNQVNPTAAMEEFQRALPYDNAPVLCNWRKQ